ncbi:MAG: CoA transferase subunit A [Chloroflexi bacterium]|nr:CoA transferase subunit A [Chloroflexota bacterium]
MSTSKIMTAAEAVARFVQDGDVAYVGYNCVPYALVHEVVRQRKRGLEVVGASQRFQAAYLFLEGCADRTRTAYIGGVMIGATRGQLVADLIRQGRLKYEEYTNQALTLMFMAGALGIPYIPTRSLLGTDFLTPAGRDHPWSYLGDAKLREAEDPFTGQRVVLLPALRPDVALYCAQRADAEGNVQAWGVWGEARWALWAARKVVVSVEEIVPGEVIRRDPNRTLIPGFKVDAIVHEPFGAHPGAMTGYYDTDFFFSRLEAEAQLDEAAYHRFVDTWITGVRDRQEYLDRYVATYGLERLRTVLPDTRLEPTASVSYAFTRRWMAGYR